MGQSTTSDGATVRPFSLQPRARGFLRQWLLRCACSPVEAALGLRRLNRLYKLASSLDLSRPFEDRAIEVLGSRIEVSDACLARVPKEGPLIVVANHPYGGIEGMAMASILRRVRPDVRIMANYLLHCIPDLRDVFFFVDPFGGPTAAARNLASIRAAIQWVQDGHVLGVFPAGEVAHLNVSKRSIADPPWSNTIGRIVLRTKAAVSPMFFAGRNSNLFQLLGIIHPRLRTAMLAREMINLRSVLQTHIGEVIPPQRLRRLETAEQVTSYLRVRTYLLKPVPSSRNAPAPTLVTNRPALTPLIDPVPPEQLLDDVQALPPHQIMVRSGDFQVIVARAYQLPHVLREIGRLRELCYRQVGEGTGQAIDLDRFDQHYLHLFVWKPEAAQIIGAYRMGPTDEILAVSGKHGLYTSTLFRYRGDLLQQISPALEMGRSFVHPDYQNSYSSLMLLWKGIGAYLAENPRYRNLFGPVSISADYSSISRSFLMAFLKMNKFLPGLAKQIIARNPPRFRHQRDWDPKDFSTIAGDLDEVSRLVSDLEQDRKPMPVLLRQYLKLNGQLMGFNVDPQFGSVLDALILVEVMKIDRRVLSKYMGAESAAKYRAYHEGLAKSGTQSQAAAG